MVWGDWCSGGTACDTLPPGLTNSGSQQLLTFNEPDNPVQSNMTVARALQLWPYLEATGLQLGSPAVTDTARGWEWLNAFMTGAHQLGYRVDFIAVHWYGDCSSASQLEAYLAQMASFGLPLWLTEFSCYQQSLETNTQFTEQIVPTLAALPYLQRIAWFTNRPFSEEPGYEFSNLVDGTASLTPVGEAYAAIPAFIDSGRQLVPGE
jgi:Glycosyl hydrolase catalytic core